MPSTIRLGTIGWSNEDWRGPFYENDVPATRMLEQYARVFPAVEIDATFYGTPRATTVTNWASLVPDDFRFSAKLPRAITHERRLIDAGEAALDFAVFMREHLGEKLGALLLQLPPDFSALEYGTVRTFLESVAGSRQRRGRFPWAIEFRNPTFRDTDVLEVLEHLGIACVTTERLDMGAPLRYVRLLGTDHSFARFDERQRDRTPELADWAERLRAAASAPDAPSSIFAFSRDYFEGHSPGTLAVLAGQLGQTLPTPPGQQQMSLF